MNHTLTSLSRGALILLILCAGGLAAPGLGAAQETPQLVLPTGHTDGIESVAFSPDGRYALSGSGDHTLKLWEVSTGREVRTFSGHTSWVNSVVFSPDGRYALSGSSDKTLKLWEVATGREVNTFSGHTDRVYTVAFSPSGQYALSGSGFSDNSLRLWEVATGREVNTFSGHTGDVNSVVFSPDGRYALSGSGDNTLKLWEVSTGNLLLIRLHLDQKGWVVVTPDGRFDGSPNGMKLLHYAKDNQSIPLDALFDRFYTPNLVAQVLSGEIKQAPKVDIRQGIAMPPLVTIPSPQAGQSFTSDALDVTVQAVDQGGGIEDIRLYHDDKLVGAEGRGIIVTSRNQNTQVRRFTVSLLPGENILRATAFSRDRTEAHPYELRVSLKAAEATAALYILSVGINDYKNAAYNLNYARTDAEAIAEALRRRGQGIFKAIQVATLYDREATRGRLVEALKGIQARARPEDVFAFFYAGHGVMSEGGSDRPSDFYFALTDVIKLYGRDDLLAQEGLSATEMKDICTGIAARKQLLMMDACQAGGAVETFAMRGAAEEKAILQLARSAGVVVLAATGTSQFAGEFKQLGHGIFTYAVLQALEGGADGSPPDGKITVKELEAYLNDRIPELTKQYRGSAQYPNSFARGQDFPLCVK